MERRGAHAAGSCAAGSSVSRPRGRMECGSGSGVSGAADAPDASSPSGRSLLCAGLGAGPGAGSPADSDGGEDLALRERKETRRPRLYKVLLHNDDFTTMDFVIEVLVRYFRKSRVEATRVMLEVHHRGIGVAGIFTYEVAETKVAQVTAEARQHGMPLKCTVDPA